MLPASSSSIICAFQAYVTIRVWSAASVQSSCDHAKSSHLFRRMGGCWGLPAAWCLAGDEEDDEVAFSFPEEEIKEAAWVSSDDPCKGSVKRHRDGVKVKQIPLLSSANRVGGLWKVVIHP